MQVFFVQDFQEVFEMRQHHELMKTRTFPTAQDGWLAFHYLREAGTLNPNLLLAAVFIAVPWRELIGHMTKETVWLVQHTQITEDQQDMDDTITLEILDSKYLDAFATLTFALQQYVYIPHEGVPPYDPHTVANAINKVMNLRGKGAID